MTNCYNQIDRVALNFEGSFSLVTPLTAINHRIFPPKYIIYVYAKQYIYLTSNYSNISIIKTPKHDKKTLECGNLFHEHPSKSIKSSTKTALRPKGESNAYLRTTKAVKRLYETKQKPQNTFGSRLRVSGRTL